VHFAKKLLDETSLPITQIAYAAGFASLRRFNAAMRGAFGVPPRQLRRGRASFDADASLTLRLAARPPFDGRRLLGYLALRALPGVEEVGPATYRRSVGRGDESGVITVELDADHCGVRLTLPARLVPAAAGLTARVRRLFDLDADPAPIRAQLRRDPALAARLRRSPGVRVPGAFCGFELAVRAVLGQQISVVGARTLAGRIVAAYGPELAHPEGAAFRLFPDAQRLASADLGGIGLTRARAAALGALAQAVASGQLDLEGAMAPEEVRRRLLALPGIGPWTAAYVALRALGEPDAFPASDLGLRRALGEAGQPLGERALEQRSKAWQPWRGYAALLLWSVPMPPNADSWASSLGPARRTGAAPLLDPSWPGHL
jgi:AraC family transcriptional regulator of adaptative response / DNA-3-methyladenine glycosylase II